MTDCANSLAIRFDAEDEQQRRRIMQRLRRANQDESVQDLRRKNNSSARKIARTLLDSNERQTIRNRDTTARRDARKNLDDQQRSQVAKKCWWDRVAELNSLEVPRLLGLHWNRKCKHCGIEVSIYRHSGTVLLRLWVQGLTNERLHDKCFVCGPNGNHFLAQLPEYPDEWNSFINDRRTANLSRKLNNLFTLTAIAVHDGDFMKFGPGISAVTLNGGRTYHRILSAREGQHAIRWFIHDPSAFLQQGSKFDIPQTWIDATLAGLNRVNPFIKELKHLRASNEDDNLALHIEQSDTNIHEIAAIISLAPASPPSRRKLVIQRKGNDKPIYLDILSPFVEPLHYLLLLPEGTLGWSPSRLTQDNKKFSQMRWYRTRFFMNAQQMSTFSRLTGNFSFIKLSTLT